MISPGRIQSEPNRLMHTVWIAIEMNSPNRIYGKMLALFSHDRSEYNVAGTEINH